VQFAARERGLSKLPASIAPRPYLRQRACDLIDEQDDVALSLPDFVEHALQALLEFAAIFCARD
jgi:hypothetical protein